MSSTPQSSWPIAFLLFYCLHIEESSLPLLLLCQTHTLLYLQSHSDPSFELLFMQSECSYGNNLRLQNDLRVVIFKPITPTTPLSPPLASTRLGGMHGNLQILATKHPRVSVFPTGQLSVSNDHVPIFLASSTPYGGCKCPLPQTPTGNCTAFLYMDVSHAC